jgi:hypothetical protein
MFKRSQRQISFISITTAFTKARFIPCLVLYNQGTSRSLLSCPTLDENLDYRNILESTKKVLHPMLHFLLNAVSA